MNYTIDEIEGIGPSYAKKLKGAGITNTKHLLGHCCDRKGRRKASKDSGVSERMLLEWANMADLMRVRGVGKQYAELLEAAGVDTVKELRNRNATNLHAAMVVANNSKKRTRQIPSISMLEAWIRQAKKLKPVIQY